MHRDTVRSNNWGQRILVSGFFQDPETLQALRAEIIPRLALLGHGDAPVRVWVEGCFTGEDVYSLAVLVLEHCVRHGASGAPLRIHGTDTSRHAIEIARRGWYPAAIENSVDVERLQRFFKLQDKGHQVSTQLSSLCTFSQQDNLGEPPFSDADLIVCRSWHHMQPSERQRRLEMFRQTLGPTGSLALGATITRAELLPGFILRSSEHGIYDTDFSQPLPMAYAAAAPPLLSLRDGSDRQREDSGVFDTAQALEINAPGVTSTIEYRQAITAAPVAVVMVAPDDTVAFVNPAFARMFGYSVHELLGRPVSDLVPPRFRSRYIAERRARLSLDATSWNPGVIERIGRRKDGTEIPVEVAVGNVQGDGSPLLVAFVTDITRRHTIERAIGHYQEKLRAFAFESALREERERRELGANLHDRLGQSLALTRIRLTEIRDAADHGLYPALDECISLIDQAVAETHEVMSDLSPPVLYDLGLVEALNWLSADFASRHGLHVTVEVATTPPPLNHDAASVIFRSVREALINVLKHSQTHNAEITIQRNGDRLHVVVSDHGVGFDVKDSTAVGATGFGLFSVRERIGRLGGHVEIWSRPNDGTRVALMVPWAPQPHRKSA